MAERFRSAFTKEHLITDAVVVAVGEYRRIGVYQVQAGEVISIGYGGLSGQENALGRIYGAIKTSAGTEITGTLRLSIYSPQDRPLKILEELHTSALNTSATDRTKQLPWPVRIEDITEDKKIVLEFRPDAAGTISKAQSTLVMDITQGVA